MPVVKGAFLDLLKPTLAWEWFRAGYRPRRKYERRKKYNAELLNAFHEWLGKLPPPNN